jgi:hypothetical protein
MELRTAITSGKRRNAQEDPICDFEREDRETSSRNFQHIMKNDGLDIVEGLAPSKAKKKKQCWHKKSRYMESPATPEVMAHRGKKKNEEKPLDDDENLN